MSGWRRAGVRRSGALCVVIGLLTTPALAEQEPASPQDRTGGQVERALPDCTGDEAKRLPACDKTTPVQESVAPGAPDRPPPEQKPVSAESAPPDANGSSDERRDIARLEKSCEAGEATACLDLGRNHDKGLGVPKDERRAAVLYEKACEGGQATGCFNLGVNYQEGHGVPQDERRAAVLYEKACEGGEATGCFNLGVSYAKGRGVPQDARRAAALYAKACARDVATACLTLGLAYEEGLGVPQDARRAAALYEKACEGGDVRGCVNLGALHAKGLGVPQDDRRAAALYEKACEGGAAQGCQNLGARYDQGLGVPKDEQRAAALYEKACEGGVATGCFNLGVNHEKGLGGPHDDLRAAALYEKACEGGVAMGCFNLGVFYKKGRGVPQDERRAVALLEKSCAGGFPLACESLGQRAAAPPEPTREASSQTTVFDVVLSSATRQVMRAAIKREGATPEREDTDYWFDLYSARGLLDGAKTLRVGYVNATSQLAILEYELPSALDTAQVGQISSMVQAKYGAPTSKEGNLGVGKVVHTWKRKDGVIITVSRGWPSTTTFLAFTVPAAKKAMDAELEANKKTQVEQRSKKNSRAF